MQTEDDIRELLKGEFDLDIPNFEKWNPPILNRQTRKPTENQRRDWIGLSVDFWMDPRLHDASPTLLIFWVKLLCVRGASGKRLTSVTVAWLQRRIGVQAASTQHTLAKLLKLGLIDVAKTDITDRQTDRQTDVGGPPTTQIVLNAEKMMTKDGINLYRSRFKDRYADQVADCYLHWEAKGKSRPFVTTLSSWHHYWVKTGSPSKLDLSWVEKALAES